MKQFKSYDMIYSLNVCFFLLLSFHYDCYYY